MLVFKVLHALIRGCLLTETAPGHLAVKVRVLATANYNYNTDTTLPRLSLMGQSIYSTNSVLASTENMYRMEYVDGNLRLVMKDARGYITPIEAEFGLWCKLQTLTEGGLTSLPRSRVATVDKGYVYSVPSPLTTALTGNVAFLIALESISKVLHNDSNSILRWMVTKYINLVGARSIKRPVMITDE